MISVGLAKLDPPYALSIPNFWPPKPKKIFVEIGPHVVLTCTPEMSAPSVVPWDRKAHASTRELEAPATTRRLNFSEVQANVIDPLRQNVPDVRRRSLVENPTDPATISPPAPWPTAAAS